MSAVQVKPMLNIAGKVANMYGEGPLLFDFLMSFKVFDQLENLTRILLEW